jgi:putative DNA primase/helicase
MSRIEWSHSGKESLEANLPPVVAATIPQVLKQHPHPQWVCWRYAPRGEGKKPDKRPINPKTLGNAGPHWPNSWSTFDTAYATYLQHRTLDDPRHLDGIGFFLTADDPYVAVDLDNCVTEEGIADPAKEVIQALESYSEVSPSSRGIRILISSPTPVDNFKSLELEIYSHKRYVTITGHRLDNSPQEINRVDPSILQSLRPPQPPVTIPTLYEGQPFTGSDLQLWEKIFEFDQFGTQHLERFNGNLSLDQGDHSLAVLRLANCLARWTGGDAARMRAMMLMSPLANEKWFSKRGSVDWIDYLIEDAIRYVKRDK